MSGNVKISWGGLDFWYSGHNLKWMQKLYKKSPAEAFAIHECLATTKGRLK